MSYPSEWTRYDRDKGIKMQGKGFKLRYLVESTSVNSYMPPLN